MGPALTASLLLASTAITWTQARQTATPTTTQQPIFRGQINAVTTQVVVHDSRGQFVSELQKSDFELYEDDVLQTLTLFSLTVGGRQLGDGRTDSRQLNGVIVPGQRVPSDMSGRIFFVLIDDANIQARNTASARSVLAKLTALIHDQDLVAIVSSGPSSIEIDPQYDVGHKRLKEAIDKTLGSGLSAQALISTPGSVNGLPEMRYMAHTGMRTAADLIEQAAAITGRRKVLIYISEGYDFDPFADSRLEAELARYGQPAGSDGSPSTATSPFRRSGNQFAEADLVADLGELVRNAVRSNVVVYPIDPRGLTAGPDINDPGTMSEHLTHVRTQHDFLQGLAANTGGFCTCDTNDFAAKLTEIDAATSDFYTLGYTSTNQDPLKLRRKLRIVVKRPGLKAIHAPDYTLARRR
jgi:VWFA-related protein